MAQVNQQNNSFEPASLPVKRKRGRPRKDDFPGSDPGRRTQRRRPNPIPSSSNGLVGQTVTGVLDGTFDAGFLLTVRVGNNGPLFRGMVFDPRLSVPVSSENDVAPQLSMLKRDGIPLSVAEELTQARAVEPLQRHNPVVATSFTNHVPETVPSRLHRASSPPYAKKVVLNDAAVRYETLKKAAAAGNAKLSPSAPNQPSEAEASKAPNVIGAAATNIAKPNFIVSHQHSQSEASNSPNVVSGGPSAVSKEAPPLTTQVSEQQTLEVPDTAESITIPPSTREGSPSSNGTGIVLPTDAPKGNETVDEMQTDSTAIHHSSQPQNLNPEPAGLPKDDQINPSTSAAPPEALSSAAPPEASTSQDNPEILQGTKISPLDNGSSKTPSSDAV